MELKSKTKHTTSAQRVKPSRLASTVPTNRKQQTKIQNILRSTGAQAKLTIGQPGDKYEQEADRVADQVMRMSDADVAQRVETETVQPMQIQRLCPECDEEMAQRQPIEEDEKLQAKEIQGQTPNVAPNLESRINSLKGGGQPLDSATRSFFEPRFGHDFSNVRVHTDSSSANTAKSINARAFTLGNHVVMGAGEYQPKSQSGQHLLSHELTHTVQQGASTSVDFIQRDLAIEPANPEAVARELSDEELQDAIEYNNRRFSNDDEIRNLRDVLGVSSESAEMDANVIRAVVEWQAINNLDQDGKVGPRTARVIGREMLAESRLDRTQRRPAKKMLERGITISLANDNYADTATTSIKNIRFNVFIPRGLNLRDYALVNFLKGKMWIVPGPTHPNVRMYGAVVPFNFPAEQVDSVDTDPIYWSNTGSRWNYNIVGRRFSATDSPSPRPGNIFNPGESANVDFRIEVFRVRDLPAITTGNVGAARPLVSRIWHFSVVRDVAGNITHP